MRFSLLILGAAISVTACNSNPKTTETTVPTISDTSVTIHEENVQPQETAKSSTTADKKKASTHESSSTSSSTMSSESENSAKAKKGWSKTAKGAVIGAAVGATTGAVVNKKNRAAGAVIGGAVGAGTGAIIGNEMDKKDGRH